MNTRLYDRVRLFSRGNTQGLRIFSILAIFVLTLVLMTRLCDWAVHSMQPINQFRVTTEQIDASKHIAVNTGRNGSYRHVPLTWYGVQLTPGETYHISQVEAFPHATFQGDVDADATSFMLTLDNGASAYTGELRRPDDRQAISMYREIASKL